MCLCLNRDEIRKNAVKLEVNKRCRQVGHGTIGLREQLPMVIGPLVGYRKKENGFANMYNIVEIRNFKPTVSE